MEEDLDKTLENYNQNLEINNNNTIEVKNKEFSLNTEILKYILYDGKLFIFDEKQPKNYPDIINYRCKNIRKYEYRISGFFCRAMVKRKKNIKNIIYELSYKHSEECIKLIYNDVVKSSNIIKNFTDFVSSCYQLLDTKENYNKAELS